MGLFISKLVYRMVVESYHFFIALFSLFNEKAYRFSKGRNIQDPIEEKEETLWFHCASLGEFEQAKPLMKWCYDKLDTPIILTFFSPSGYQYKNNYPLAKAVYYLPKDNPKNARKFISKIKPKAAFFIKYEFWYFFLAELKRNDIPHFLIAGIFRKDQIFFKFYGVLHQKMLASFTHLFVQDESSLNLLKSHQITACSVAHDTRFDSVWQISQLNYQDEVIEKFTENGKTVVLGSSWLKDELLFKEVLADFKDHKFIIAPHEVNPHRIKQLQQNFPRAVLLSEPLIENNTRVMIVDSIGKLSLLYRYADICYIGGGFGVSVHNVLEAAVYGKALIYGPHHGKSKEALDLHVLQAAKVVRNTRDLKMALAEFKQKESYRKACAVAKKYVEERTGGTQEIMSHLKKKRIL